MTSSEFSEYFRSDNGQRSMGRLICFICTMLVLATSIGVSIAKQEVCDIPYGWACFIAMMYGVNKFGTKPGPVEKEGE